MWSVHFEIVFKFLCLSKGTPQQKSPDCFAEKLTAWIGLERNGFKRLVKKNHQALKNHEIAFAMLTGMNWITD